VARKSRSRDHTPRHVRIHHYMMETEAWKSLGVTERAMYVDIASRYAGPGSNNGRIHYSVREAAERLHIGKSSAARGIANLEERGFIVAEKRGAFSLKARHATEWRLTEFASDISKDFATKEFVRWRPENKTRYPEQDRTVPAAGPVGTSNGTVPDSNTSHGISSGTVSTDSQRSRYS
jgi:DNA-binding transcriptional MocR family regulator